MPNIIAIVEGVEESLLLREVQKGTLPWWDKAIKRSSFIPMDCGPVPYEPSNLATAFSGSGPGHHGCYSYWESHVNSGIARILESRDVKVPRIWEWSEFSDTRFSVVNVQLTHPPLPMNGNLISYPMQQTLHATYPKNFLLNLAKKGVRYAHDVSAFYKGEPLDQFAHEIRRIAKFQFDTIKELAEDCDVLIANFTIADRLSHFLWSEIQDNTKTSHLLDAYQFIDESLKELETYTKDSDFFMVFSEIGFGHVDYFASIDQFLQKQGFQKATGAEIDLENSIAREAVQGSHGINLIFSNGVEKANRYNQRLEEVQEALLSFRFSDGTPVVKSALPREEVYQGPWTHYAPDIIITPADPNRPPMGDPYWANHVNRHLQTGWHRDNGFCLVLNKHFEQVGNKKASLEAIAPTICSLTGKDIPKHCKTVPLF